MNTIIKNINETLNETIDETTNKSTDNFINSSNSTIKKRTFLKHKNIKFIEERKLILNKILNIIGITETNKIFRSYDLDLNINAQKEILNLCPDILKYFSTSLWASFRSDRTITKRYLSIIKSILKEMNINFSVTQTSYVENKIRIKTLLFVLL